VRGDLFWGFGPEAGALAGRMKHRGKLWLLLPKGVDPRGPRQAGR
jgi:membrane-bound lytic murein transglycosylase A